MILEKIRTKNLSAIKVDESNTVVVMESSHITLGTLCNDNNLCLHSSFENIRKIINKKKLVIKSYRLLFRE